MNKKTPVLSAALKIILRLFGIAYKVLCFVAAVPVVLLVRIIRPLLLVRLCMVGIDRIGNPYCVLWYVSEKRSGRMLKKKCWDIFFFSPFTRKISNVFWFRMIQRGVYFFPIRRLAWSVYILNQKLPRHEEYAVYHGHPPELSVAKNSFKDERPFLGLTAEEESCGKDAVRSLGMTPEDEFICFHTRDASYLNFDFKGRDWSYHDYRDTSIKNFELAARKYAEQTNCYAVRMGAVVEEKLTTDHPRIIDYATNGTRTDFLDVYLSAKCKFFLGTDCGLTILPENFRRPIVYTNLVSIQLIPHYINNAVAITKRWYLVSEKRFLTFAEVMKIAEPHNIDARKLGVEFVDNTPEEMLEAIEELEQRIQGNVKDDAEDIKRQNRFWDIYSSVYGLRDMRPPNFFIGRKFLYDNRDLLK